MIWNLNLTCRQQQQVGCILIGKMKLLPFVSIIYGSLKSTSNPTTSWLYFDWQNEDISLCFHNLQFFEIHIQPPSLGLQRFFFVFYIIITNEFFFAG
jgi:hypothetical protein